VAKSPLPPGPRRHLRLEIEREKIADFFIWPPETTGGWTARRNLRAISASRQEESEPSRCESTPKRTQEMIRLYNAYTHLSLDRRRIFDHL
jgi:hypothetical protein